MSPERFMNIGMVVAAGAFTLDCIGHISSRPRVVDWIVDISSQPRVITQDWIGDISSQPRVITQDWIGDISSQPMVITHDWVFRMQRNWGETGLA